MDRRFKSAKTVSPNQKVIIPGDLEAELDPNVIGIPLIDAVVKDLNELAGEVRCEKFA